MTTDAYDDRPNLLWKPPLDGQFTRLEIFRRFVNRKHGLNLKDYYELHRYSVERWDFWKDLWDFTGVISSVPPTQIIIDRPQTESPEFFPGSRLNFAENQLKWDGDKIAITAARETGSVEHYTRRQLRALVRDMSNALRAHGAMPGDRIAAVVTNAIHGVVVALAAATIGAIFTSASPDMGVSGILDRYRQVTPKFLFAETEVLYAGKTADVVPNIAEVARQLSSGYGLEKTILLPSTVTGKYPRVDVVNGIFLSEFLEAGKGGQLVFEQLPFKHPLWILYSSGTTGPPKCIVHSAGGSMIQCLKEHTLAFNMSEDDCYLQYSTTGWVMFPALISALAVGCRVVLYDGSPFHPEPHSFLKLTHDQGVSVVGISPRYLSEIQGRGIRPGNIGSFDSLKIVYVTGAVLTAPMFRWVYQVFPPVHVVSGSGGTDIFAAFVTGVPSLPVHAGEIQGKALGMKVAVFGPEGNNTEDTGQAGELVCTRAHPSLPLFFWNDPGRKKYHAAYFSTYPGVWKQGDFMVVNPATRGIRILGRSDGVLNPSGVRFGSAEIYAVLERFSAEVDDALCVSQRRAARDTDERVLLFLKMRGGRTLTRALEWEIRAAIRDALSRRHEPAYVFEVKDIPYTVNMKKVEVAVKQIVSGMSLKVSATVANPEALDEYYKFAELEELVGPSRTKL